jgi:hypothetical protein
MIPVWLNRDDWDVVMYVMGYGAGALHKDRQTTMAQRAYDLAHQMGNQVTAAEILKSPDSGRKKGSRGKSS